MLLFDGEEDGAECDFYGGKGRFDGGILEGRWSRFGGQVAGGLTGIKEQEEGAAEGEVAAGGVVPLVQGVHTASGAAGAYGEGGDSEGEWEIGVGGADAGGCGEAEVAVYGAEAAVELG